VTFDSIALTRNQPSEVTLQTFPAPPSSPNPLVASFGTKRPLRRVGAPPRAHASRLVRLSAGSLSAKIARKVPVRSASAVASATVVAYQRRQRADLLVSIIANAVNRNKHPVGLVYIDLWHLFTLGPWTGMRQHRAAANTPPRRTGCDRRSRPPKWATLSCGERLSREPALTTSPVTTSRTCATHCQWRSPPSDTAPPTRSPTSTSRQPKLLSTPTWRRRPPPSNANCEPCGTGSPAPTPTCTSRSAGKASTPAYKTR